MIKFEISLYVLIMIYLCSFHPQDLILRGDVSSGAKDQFENEAKMAVRLANFISAFLQVRVRSRSERFFPISFTLNEEQ